MSDLKDFRKSIDLIDNAIVNLLAERVRVVCRIGAYKKTRSVPQLDEKRWQEVLKSKIVKAKKLGVNPNLIKEIYKTIHKYALKMEGKV